MDRSKYHKFHRNRFGHLLENGIPATEGGSVTFDDPHLELVSDVGTRDLPVDWVQSCGILASRHVFLSGITWETLRKQGLVYGRKITLYGQDYLLRCPQVANHGEWEQFVAATSQDIEWRAIPVSLDRSSFLATVCFRWIAARWSLMVGRSSMPGMSTKPMTLSGSG